MSSSTPNSKASITEMTDVKKADAPKAVFTDDPLFLPIEMNGE